MEAGEVVDLEVFDNRQEKQEEDDEGRKLTAVVHPNQLICRHIQISGQQKLRPKEMAGGYWVEIATIDYLADSSCLPTAYDYCTDYFQSDCHNCDTMFSFCWKTIWAGASHFVSEETLKNSKRGTEFA